MTANKTIGFEGVHGFLSNLFDGDLHAKRVLSLANTDPIRPSVCRRGRRNTARKVSAVVIARAE